MAGQVPRVGPDHSARTVAAAAADEEEGRVRDVAPPIGRDQRRPLFVDGEVRRHFRCRRRRCHDEEENENEQTVIVVVVLGC
jgi:hypothetical protein